MRRKRIGPIPITPEGFSIAARVLGLASHRARIKKLGMREYRKQQRERGENGGKYGYLGGRPPKQTSLKSKESGGK